MDEETKEILKQYDARLKRIESLLFEKKIPVPSAETAEIWDMGENRLTLIATVGNGIREKTLNAVLLTLLGYKEKLKQDKVLASEIKRNVAINKIPVDNFGTYINELIPQMLLRMGNAKSPKVTYKLTTFGYAQAREILEKMLKNET